MIVKDENGEDIEVLTQAEVDEKLKAETDRITSEKETELEKERDERKVEQEELEKLRGKDMNFENLRKKADGKEVEINEEIKTELQKINERIDQVAELPKNEVREDFVKENIGEDKEKKELFDYYYDRLGAEAKTKEEVIKAAKEALVLASGGSYQPDVHSNMYSTGASQNYRNTPTGEVSESSKEIGAALGITEEDRKKYGNK